MGSKHFDRAAAENYILVSGTPVEQVRLSHWNGQADIESLWQALSRFQNWDGGWAHGIDPDYVGPVSSIHSTISALRVLVMHRLGEDQRVVNTVRFLKQAALPDGTWQETPEVQQHGAPDWYQPAEFRVWEASTLAGYCLTLGYTDLWPAAAGYVRKVWSSMPPADVPHPYWATLLLLGRSAGRADRDIVSECRSAIEGFIYEGSLDPYDAVWALEALLYASPEPDDNLARLLHKVILDNQDEDGGVLTAYGPHLGVETTLYALCIDDQLSRLRGG